MVDLRNIINKESLQKIDTQQYSLRGMQELNEIIQERINKNNNQPQILKQKESKDRSKSIIQNKSNASSFVNFPPINQTEYINSRFEGSSSLDNSPKREIRNNPEMDYLIRNNGITASIKYKKNTQKKTEYEPQNIRSISQNQRMMERKRRDSKIENTKLDLSAILKSDQGITPRNFKSIKIQYQGFEDLKRKKRSKYKSLSQRRR